MKPNSKKIGAKMKNNLTIIVAMAKNNVIGDRNKMPWYIPEELQEFKRITTPHNLIMGRLTYESLGKLLPNRTSYILTKDDSFSVPGAIIINGFEEMMAEVMAKPDEQFFVMGGGSMFEQYLPVVGKMIISEVDLVVDGDVRFPEFDLKNWNLVKEKKIANKQDINIIQKHYERILP